MRPTGERLTAGRVLAAVLPSMALALALAGCVTSSASGPAAPSPATPGTAVPPTASGAFTVSGDHPVTPNDSQATSAATPGTACDSGRLAQDAATGRQVAGGFSLAGFSAAAALLDHFLGGTGAAVGYPAGSSISRQAKASSAFQAIDKQVRSLVLKRLRAGQTRVELPAWQLPLVAFESLGTDLYWGFRGTQGLAVTGSGSLEHGRYVGTLTYVITDSYGFPAGETLAGFGPPMRYLQTVCGAPQHAGGARWFPDTITVPVPFSQPA
jgi:hypothetical protein